MLKTLTKQYKRELRVRAAARFALPPSNLIAICCAIRKSNPEISGDSYLLISRFLGLDDFKIRGRKKKQVVSDRFLESYEWRKLRMQALKLHGARCQCCGSSAKDGVRINVDHIKPRKKYPQLALKLENLQVLCGACSHGKGNWDETDWR